MLCRTTLLLVLLLAACGGDASTTTAPDVPGLEPMDLARVGTIGWHPDDIPGPVAILDLHREGRMTLNGEEIPDYPALERVLRPLADADREEEGLRESRLHLVIRADRDVPWRAAQWALQAAANPEVRVSRTLFGVLPLEGDREGTLALFLPKDRGAGAAFTGRGMGRAVRGSVRLRTGGDGSADPVKQAIAKVASDGTAGFEIDAEGDVPVGVVLRVLDVLLRRCVGSITVTGTPWPDPGVGPPAAAAAPPSVAVVPVNPPERAGQPSELPVPERVDGLAGVTTSPDSSDPVIEKKILHDEEEDEPK